MKIKFYLLVLVLSTVSSLSIAQVSYNKRAMGLIGDAPKPGNFLNGATLDNVDKSTGVLKIGIPLYEIKVNDISVPITLNYTATGIKVGQEAGVAGMGWELSAGGKIITNVQGKSDDDGSIGMLADTLPASLNVYSPTTSDKLRLNNILDGVKDNAWDTYTYILPHSSGTYTKNGLTFPYDPMVSVMDHTNNDLINNTITTSDGLVYRFISGDARTTTKTINYDGSGYSGSPFTTTYTAIDHDPLHWRDYDLSSITSSRFKDVVNFKYHQFGGYPDIVRLGAKTRINYSESMVLYRQVYAGSLGGNGWYPTYGDQMYTTESPMINKSTTTYDVHSRLDTISYTTGMVVFDYDPVDVLGRDVLDSIRIFKKDANNVLTLIKRYEFSYQSEKRYGHYLSGISIYDSNNVLQNGWKFHYINDYLPVKPDSTCMAVDEWGFYNGRTNYTLLEDPHKVLALNNFSHYPISGDLHFRRDEQVAYYKPQYTPYPSPLNNEFILPFANRSANPAVVAYGTLDTVETPSGGSYAYEYESHSFLVMDYSTGVAYNALKLGGGIRVKSITALRLHQNAYYGSPSAEFGSKKVFTYGDSSTGYTLNSPHEVNNYGSINLPQLVLANTSVYTDPNYSPTTQPQSYYKNSKNFVLVSNPINDLNICNGSYVMYKSVTETDLSSIDPYAAPLGETVYYSNLPQFDPFQQGGWQSANPPPYPENNSFNPYLLPQVTDPGTFNSGVSGEQVYAPYFSGNMGFKPEDGAGLYRTTKAKYDPSTGLFKPVENTDYTYNYFRAPQNNPLWSLYVAASGQLSGEIPVTDPHMDMYDLPEPPVGAPGYRYNAVQSGYDMDFTTRSAIVDMPLQQDFPGRYAGKMVNLNNFSYCKKVVKEAVQVIDDNSFRQTDYTYDNINHMQPTTISKMASTGDQTVEHLSYAIDYPMSNDIADFLKYNPMEADQPIMDYVTYKQIGHPGTNKMVGGTVNTYAFQNDAILPDKVYKITPAPNKSGQSAPDGIFPWGVGPNGVGGQYVDSTLYKPVLSYDYYIKGQVHQYTDNKGADILNQGKSTVLLYGYHNQYPIAKVVNAGNYDAVTQRSMDVAYTSFETKDTCNWIYAGNPVADSTAISGKSVYPLSAGAINKLSATLAGKYILSYWYKSGSAVSVSGGTIGAEVVKNRLGPWILVEREVSNISGTLSVSGSGYIDELRFFPKEAQMTTYIYDPGLGLTCSFDINGKPVYYEYDSMQRLAQIRDHNGNIIKAYKYITDQY